MLDIEQIYRIGYTTRQKEKDYDPLGDEAVCDAIEEVRNLQQEVERLTSLITTHNEECDYGCKVDPHCDHRPRQCASCPKDWKIEEGK